MNTCDILAEGLHNAGCHIRAFRVNHGLSQVEFAIRADVARPVISNLESGGKHIPTIESLARIACSVGLPLADLLRPRPTPPRFSPRGRRSR